MRQLSVRLLSVRLPIGAFVCRQIGASARLAAASLLSLAGVTFTTPVIAQDTAMLDTEALLSQYVTQQPKPTIQKDQSSRLDSPDVIHLRAAIRRYQRLVDSGGWPQVDRGRTLRPGDEHQRVAQLRVRLHVTGDLRSSGNLDSEHYDAGLNRAVRRFQLRHGLKADGIIGKSTIAAMNESAVSKLRRLRINLDRHKALPRHAGRHVVVNVPEYRMRLFDAKEVVLAMDVVVGKKRFPTPQLSDTIDYIVLNPYWNLPRTIAVREVLPKIQSDPNYLVEQQMEALQGSKVVDPHALPWQDYNVNQFPVRLRQRPGPINALGTMKFIFPNPHNVYLHDTPVRWAFEKTKRALSHGCVRLEHPAALAQALLADNASVRPEQLRELTDSGTRKVVNLRQPVPVDIVYLTAKADAGMVWFYPDLYRRDEPDALVAPELLAATSELTPNEPGLSLYEFPSDPI